LLGAAKFANEVVGRRPCRRFPALARVPRSAKCSKRVNRPKRAGLGNRGLIIYNRGGFSRRKAITIPSTKPRIAIASDHAGFSVKETIRRHLESAGYAVSDLGTSSEESVDYPDYGKAVGERGVSKQADLGIARLRDRDGDLHCGQQSAGRPRGTSA